MQEEIFRARNVDVNAVHQQRLEKVNFYVLRGEILGILGMMDAGKTTLAKMICGKVEPVSGYLYYNGEMICRNGTRLKPGPKAVIVDSELALAERMTVWENLILSRSGPVALIVNPVQSVRMASVMLQNYGMDIDPRARVSELTSSEKQLLKILCARMSRAEIVILEELPDTFTPLEYLRLKKLLENISAEGISIILTSCHLHPLTVLSKRVLLLYKQHIVASLHETNIPQMSHILSEMFAQTAYGITRSATDRVAITFTGFMDKNGMPMSFSVHAGEIVAVIDSTGLLIHDLRNALTGSGKSNGVILLGEKKLKPMKERMVQNGLVYIGCSLADLITQTLSPVENLCIGDYRRFSNGGIIKRRVSKYVAGQFDQWYGDSSVMERMHCADLPGADKIAIILFRLKLMRPSVLILDEQVPSLNQASSGLLLKTLKELAEDGTGICLWNTNIEAVKDIADFSLVL